MTSSSVRHRGKGEGVTLSPDRLLSATSVRFSKGRHSQRQTTRLPSSLPSWLWCVLSFGLGVRQDEPPARVHIYVSTALRILTIVTALGFGVIGLVVNVYEVLNKSINRTILICLFKSAVGAFWISLGLYSHSLAVRSFKKKDLLDYIRLHSKTFMKISTTVWITLLCVSVLGTNVYSNTYLLGDDNDENKTELIDPTCASIDLEVSVCQVYFGFKVAFSFLNLVWIMTVTGVCLSVCRTHVICIRRFMKELSYDSKIFEEFSLLKISQQSTESGEPQEMSNDDSYQDDIIKEDEDQESPSKRKKVWDSLREMRHSALGQRGKKMTTNNMKDSSVDGQSIHHEQTTQNEILNDGEKSSQGKKSSRGVKTSQNEEIEKGQMKEVKDFTVKDATDGRGKCNNPAVDEQDIHLFSDLSIMKAPIMSNQDLLFTYFKIVRHLSTTSRLLQRWITSSILFVAMWCLLLVIYWVSYDMRLADMFQFLVPLVMLGLLISAYAEVNFEGNLMYKYVLPTEDRMLVMYYVHNTPMALKVYTYTLSYSVLATFVAGAAISFATKIILAMNIT